MPDTDAVDERFDLAPTDAAALIGVNVKTLHRWEADGILPSRRTPGGHRRFRRSDVLALLSAEPETAAS